MQFFEINYMEIGILINNSIIFLLVLLVSYYTHLTFHCSKHVSCKLKIKSNLKINQKSHEIGMDSKLHWILLSIAMISLELLEEAEGKMERRCNSSWDAILFFSLVLHSWCDYLSCVLFTHPRLSSLIFFSSHLLFFSFAPSKYYQ